MRHQDTDNDAAQDMMDLARPKMPEPGPISADGKDKDPAPEYPSAHLEFDHPVEFPKGEFHGVVVGHVHHEEHDMPIGGKHKHHYHIHLKAMHVGGEVQGKPSKAKPMDSADMLEQRMMGDSRGN